MNNRIIQSFKTKDDKEFAGRFATIETSGHLSLPWDIVLDDGKVLASCGSYATARHSFDRFGLAIK